MAESKTWKGSCHCGSVRYEVDTDLSKVIECNCSMCGRAGTMLTFVPTSSFRLLSGEDSQTDYQFNKHHIHHTFCKVCGIKSFARGTGSDGTVMVAVNARCLEGVDPRELKTTFYDGRSS
jgi:hypothetical protein